MPTLVQQIEQILQTHRHQRQEAALVDALVDCIVAWAGIPLANRVKSMRGRRIYRKLTCSFFAKRFKRTGGYPRPRECLERL